MAKNEATVAITASPKSSFSANAVKCSEDSTGTIEASNQLSGAASAGWNPPDLNATLEPSMSWFFRSRCQCHQQLLGDKNNYQAQLQLNIAAVIRASQVTAIDSIDKKLMALQQELIQKANSKEDYDEIADEIFRFRELRQKTTVDTSRKG